MCRKLCVPLENPLKWPESGKICGTFWISFSVSTKPFIGELHGETVTGLKKVVRRDSFRIGQHTALVLLEATLDLFILLCHSPSIFCPDFMASLLVFDPSFF